jgi:hypothetical protein
MLTKLYTIVKEMSVRRAYVHVVLPAIKAFYLQLRIRSQHAVRAVHFVHSVGLGALRSPGAFQLMKDNEPNVYVGASKPPFLVAHLLTAMRARRGRQSGYLSEHQSGMRWECCFYTGTFVPCDTSID